ncbi:hypothetical protein BpHYR1_034722 [Brachionus plicatilis]|uniref:Uncharacterized protein n=1 Tax=Brachionus plicatilis TaxID=10195 RepID=A0A3M7QC82_BRAPC|nr:hypothetical protein BpHYR1_034722 [Brachionus plicatilis]
MKPYHLIFKSQIYKKDLPEINKYKKMSFSEESYILDNVKEISIKIYNNPVSCQDGSIVLFLAKHIISFLTRVMTDSFAYKVKIDYFCTIFRFLYYFK